MIKDLILCSFFDSYHVCRLSIRQHELRQYLSLAPLKATLFWTRANLMIDAKPYMQSWIAVSLLLE